MKKIFVFIAALFITASSFGQAPASFKYQAVLRDARGNIRANISTNIIISILSGSATGTAVYTETHSVKTDGYGLINLEIGNGSPTVGTMSSIDWSTGTYFVMTTVDGVVMGTNQLLSVPFAQYANRAANGLSKADSAKLAGIDGSETHVIGSANVTVTGTGTTKAPYVITTAANPAVHKVGDSYGGGIVFYVYDGGLHGLIAATEDQSTGIEWWIDPYNNHLNISAERDGIGAGMFNTERIIIGQTSNNYAAQVCADFQDAEINSHGDWYLPADYELKLMFTNLKINGLGNFANDIYWSSTGYTEDNDGGHNFYILARDFATGNQISIVNNGWSQVSPKYFVRAIRAF